MFYNIKILYTGPGFRKQNILLFTLARLSDCGSAHRP